MKKPFSRWGCLVGGALILLLLLAGGGLLYFRSQNSAADSPSPSQVFVFLLSPTSGEELQAGDFVPVTAQVVAPDAIISTEFFVDGQSMDVVTDEPQNVSWTWQALPVGIHTLSARATLADGQTGQSQTVIVNVLARDDSIKVPAEEGQTLEQIGAGFGVPPEQMADVNPHVDPTQPLPEGQPVQVPVGGGGTIQPEDGGAVNGSIPILINWQFQSNEPVDKSYCYTSTGDGNWRKMPKDPFEFFNGPEVNYPQYALILNSEDGVIQVECWGWLGGLLKFLGQGETKFDVLQPPDEVMINGDGFVLVGLPQLPPGVENFTGGGGLLTIPPPYALREAQDYTECDSHGVSATPCSIYWTSQVIQNVLLIWEWQSEICWPGYCKYGINEIDGYYLYELDQLTNTQKYMKEVNNPGQKVALLPLPWGYKCYGVKAYVEGPEYGGQIVSEMATYCPGQPLQTETMVLNPTDWITTGGQWVQDGDCNDFGTGDDYLLANANSGFGNNSEVLVGSYIVDNEGKDCFKQGDYSGGVKFGQPVLPPGAVVQKAILKFSEIFTDYGASGVATNYKLFCVSGVGKANQDWTGLNGGNHFVGKNILSSSAYISPFYSLSSWDNTPEVDVTAVVNIWIKYPQQNHGFILTPASAPNPAVDGSGSCESGVGNFQLEIHYFVPPQS